MQVQDLYRLLEAKLWCAAQDLRAAARQGSAADRTEALLLAYRMDAIRAAIPANLIASEAPPLTNKRGRVA